MTKRFVFLLGCLFVAQTACSRRTLPARGELLVLISSDMQVPDSFDALVLKLANEPSNVRHVYLPSVDGKNQWLALDKTNSKLDADCVPQDGDARPLANLKLPTTLGLQSKSNDETNTELTVTACKAGTKLFSTTLAVTLPSEGETTMKRVPIRWLCADKGGDNALGCYSCDSTRCYGKNTHPDTSATSPCSVDTCETAHHDEAYPTVLYDAEETSRYQSNGDEPNTSGCFDVLGCFSTSNLATPSGNKSHPATVDWRQRPTDGIANTTLQCVAHIDSPTYDLSRLNLALVLPPRTQGTCTDTYCLVALEADSPLGYRVNPDNREELLLPSAVCNLLDSGQVLSVLATDACAPRSLDTPVCGSVTKTTDIDTGARKYGDLLEHYTVSSYGFDETTGSGRVFVDDRGGVDLGLVSPEATSETLPRVDGVVGFAQTFDSRHYAVSQVRIDYPQDFTLNAWVALPEWIVVQTAERHLQLTPEARFSVLSSLSKDCTNGFRLELVRCSTDRPNSVQIAFAQPTGALDNGACKLKWSYATFASQSWAGGYFSPFKHGDFRQLTVSCEQGKQPTIYVDGALATDTTDTACAPGEAASSVNDDSFFYIGSHAGLTQSPTSPTGSFEIDEVTLYERALTADEVRFSYANPSTALGPGGLNWGAWATQGGSATVESTTRQKVTVSLDDQAFSSAGLYALLGPQTNPGVFAVDEQSDLSNFDEVVLWVDLPVDTPFQFALSADHGRQQCTWQLRASTAPYYVINLKQPSWCIDPRCGFDLTKVERLSVGSDWSAKSVNYSRFSISALAFRKRLLSAQDQSTGSLTRLGGLPGPNGWCWRAVSYDPLWLTRLTRYTADQGNRP